MPHFPSHTAYIRMEEGPESWLSQPLCHCGILGRQLSHLHATWCQWTGAKQLKHGSGPGLESSICMPFPSGIFLAYVFDSIIIRKKREWWLTHPNCSWWWLLQSWGQMIWPTGDLRSLTSFIHAACISSLQPLYPTELIYSCPPERAGFQIPESDYVIRKTPLWREHFEYKLMPTLAGITCLVHHLHLCCR